MRVTFTDDELAFRDEVRTFFREELPEDIVEKQRLGVPLERDDHIRFQKALFHKGWAGFNWPVEYGGTGWTIGASTCSRSSRDGTTWFMRQPLRLPTSMYSMRRTIWPVPRKCSSRSNTV